MTSFATSPASPLNAIRSRDETTLSVALSSDLAAVEAVWRELEGRAVLSPYQRFDWIKAYLQAGFEPEAACVFAVLSHNDLPIALLPLTLKSRFGIRIAQIIGMPISNMDSLIFDPRYVDLLTPAVLRDMFSKIAHAGHRADVVSFHCLFKDWQGTPNPLLALSHALAPNRLYFEALEPFDPKGGYVLPKKRRKNIRYSLRKFAEEFGPLRLTKAQTPAEIEHIEAVFLEHRSRRFADMGIDNIFADPKFRRFFKDLANAEIGHERPALTFHALYAGDLVLATSVGAYTHSHYTHYMNSTASGAPSKYSIIGSMLSLLIDDLRREGIESIDIGLGDFGYKTEWSEPVDVYDSLTPVTAKGAIAAPALRAMRSLKRTIKQTPALWTLAQKIMALRVRLRSARS